MLKELKEKSKELKEIKSIIPFNLEPGEKLMCVVIVTEDQQLQFPVICKNTDIFTRLEQIIYDAHPEYSETENFFLLGGNKINKYKSLDYNKIKNNDIISMHTFE